MSKKNPVVRHLLSITRALYVLVTVSAVFIVLVRLNFGGY